MKIIADLHTHTNVSHHAYSTLEEMALGAKRVGLDAIAVTNHGPAMEDGAHRWHFSCFILVPKEIYGVKIISGIEMNILAGGVFDPDEEECAKHLSFRIASLHEPCFTPVDEKTHTEALENVLKNPVVDCLGHLGNPLFPIDKERIISQCNQFGKIVEMNNNSLIVRKGSYENCKEIALLCKKYKVPVVVNTDAHISFALGEMGKVGSLLEEIHFPEELICNTSKAKLNEYFENYRKMKIFE